MPQFYMYVYRDPSRNNEPIYVGKGQGRRAYKHLKRKDKHPFTHRLQLMKRNGVEPDIQILPCESEEFALLAEEEAIDKFGRKDLGSGTLLNLTDGGEGISNPSAETRKKISEAQKGENNHNYGKSPSAVTRQKNSGAHKGENNPNYGKSASDETRNKMSDAHKGKSHSAETRNNMSVSKKGENNAMYGTAHSAASKQKISDTLKSKPRVTCPHCSTEGDVGNMKRWHFNNCKSRNKDDK